VFHKSHPDAIACGQVTINDQPITLVSLYGKIIDGYSITTLHRSLSDLTHLFIQSDIRDWLLIGGDFNADVALDERQPGKSHHLFFERLKDFGLKDCREKFNRERAQTLRHKKSAFAWQNDYLFAGKKIYDKCTSCQVIDDESLYELSDHNPIVAEFDLSTTQLRLLRI
jgi:exonuclease III